MRAVRFSNRPCSDGDSEYDRPGLHLWIGFGRRHDISQDDVGITYSQFGDVQSVDIHESPGNHYAIVSFCTQEAALAAYNNQPKVQNAEAFVEWFHPGEPLGQAPPAPEGPSPQVPPEPQKQRTVVLRYPSSSAMMEDEVRERLTMYGDVETVALTLEGDTKVAHVVFARQQSARACLERAVGGDPVFNDTPGCSVEVPSEAPAAIEAPKGEQEGEPARIEGGAPLLLIGAGPGGALRTAPPAAAAAALSSAVPTAELCLAYQDSTAAQAQTSVSTALGGPDAGVRDAQNCDRFVFVRFGEADSAGAAKRKVESGELKLDGDPAVVFARRGARESVQSTSPAPPPAAAPPDPAPNSEPSNALVLAGAVGAAPAAPGAAAAWGAFASPPVAKSSTPPACSELKKLIDEAAEEYTRVGEDCEAARLVLLTDNAAYLRYKIDAIRMGVTNDSVDALARLRAAAAKRTGDGEAPEHLRQYDEPGETPFSESAPTLLLGEGDFSFSVALARRYGSAQGLCCTTLLTKEETLQRYPDAAGYTAALVALGGEVAYGFDVTEKEGWEQLKARGSEYARVIFNLPCTVDDDGNDDPDPVENERLFKKLFKYMPKVLQSRGLVYVTLLSGPQITAWKPSRACLEADTGLRLVNRFPFRREEYEGYTYLMPTGDPAARFRTPWTLVFGKKKKFEPFDEVEERDVELARIKSSHRKKKKKKSSSSSSDSESRGKKKRRRSRSRDRSRARRRRR
eukprot:Hpha_TRINITY_DN15039_c1_g2::TRINITY_DN15039_c1_g2_i2::g.124875::m.124875